MALETLRQAHRDILDEVARVREGTSDLFAVTSLVLDHFGVEERILLPNLAPLLPGGSGPTPGVLEDHARVRSLLLSDPPDLDRIEDLLRAHFAKEEELLYPFAESRLTAAVLEEIER